MKCQALTLRGKQCRRTARIVLPDGIGMVCTQHAA